MSITERDELAAAEAVQAHWLQFTDDGWICTGCNWTSKTIADYWATHGARKHDDNIPF